MILWNPWESRFVFPQCRYSCPNLRAPLWRHMLDIGDHGHHRLAQAVGGHIRRPRTEGRPGEQNLGLVEKLENAKCVFAEFVFEM